jgi:outer membrane protein OmpA-like peptidoglycan-associated protein
MIKLFRFRFTCFLFLEIIFHSSVCLSQTTQNLSIFFEFNKYFLDKISMNKIDSILMGNQVLSVSINAHCDSIGNNSYNDNLSTERAMEVKKYLISKNISESLITTKGSGKRFPLNNNENDKARAMNRRAEIVFTVETLQVIPIADTISRDTTTIDIEKVEIGSTFRLENLNFEPGSHKLKKKSLTTLDLLFNTMKTNPDLVIEIHGHVCCIPFGEGFDFDTRTNNLSANRAKAIYEYLIKNGIDKKRLSYKGFGADHKLVEERSREDEDKNRRVEIKIINK